MSGEFSAPRQPRYAAPTCATVAQRGVPARQAYGGAGGTVRSSSPPASASGSQHGTPMHSPSRKSSLSATRPRQLAASTSDPAVLQRIVDVLLREGHDVMEKISQQQPEEGATTRDLASLLENLTSIKRSSSAGSETDNDVSLALQGMKRSVTVSEPTEGNDGAETARLPQERDAPHNADSAAQRRSVSCAMPVRGEVPVTYVRTPGVDEMTAPRVRRTAGGGGGGGGGAKGFRINVASSATHAPPKRTTSPPRQRSPPRLSPSTKKPEPKRTRSPPSTYRDTRGQTTLYPAYKPQMHRSAQHAPPQKPKSKLFSLNRSANSTSTANSSVNTRRGSGGSAHTHRDTTLPREKFSQRAAHQFAVLAGAPEHSPRRTRSPRGRSDPSSKPTPLLETLRLMDKNLNQNNRVERSESRSEETLVEPPLVVVTKEVTRSSSREAVVRRTVSGAETGMTFSRGTSEVHCSPQAPQESPQYVEPARLSPKNLAKMPPQQSLAQMFSHIAPQQHNNTAARSSRERTVPARLSPRNLEKAAEEASPDYQYGGLAEFSSPASPDVASPYNKGIPMVESMVRETPLDTARGGFDMAPQGGSSAKHGEMCDAAAAAKMLKRESVFKRPPQAAHNEAPEDSSSDYDGFEETVNLAFGGNHYDPQLPTPTEAAQSPIHRNRMDPQEDEKLSPVLQAKQSFPNLLRQASLIREQAQEVEVEAEAEAEAQLSPRSARERTYSSGSLLRPNSYTPRQMLGAKVRRSSVVKIADPDDEPEQILHRSISDVRRRSRVEEEEELGSDEDYEGLTPRRTPGLNPTTKGTSKASWVKRTKEDAKEDLTGIKDEDIEFEEDGGQGDGAEKMRKRREELQKASYAQIARLLFKRYDANENMLLNKDEYNLLMKHISWDTSTTDAFTTSIGYARFHVQLAESRVTAFRTLLLAPTVGSLCTLTGLTKDSLIALNGRRGRINRVLKTGHVEVRAPGGRTIYVSPAKLDWSWKH